MGSTRCKIKRSRFRSDFIKKYISIPELFPGVLVCDSVRKMEVKSTFLFISNERIISSLKHLY